MRTKLFPLVLAVLAPLATSCFVSVDVGAPHPLAFHPPGSSFASALDTIETEELRADVRFLASEQLGGRDTPSLGLEVAARYIRSRLEHLGWRPGAREGYFHVYELVSVGLDPKGTGAAIESGETSVELTAGVDYTFFPRADGGHEVRGRVVFAGTLSEEDASGLDIEGAWALARESADVGWRGRRRNAEEAGAVGVIVVPAARAAEEEEGEPAPSFHETLGTPLERTMFQRDSPRPTYPFVYLERAAAERLFSLATSREPAVGEELGLSFVERRAYEIRETHELENVVGFWPGTDRADEAIIVSAHYDHVGTDAEGRIFHGADDNASGTSGLMALAEALVEYGPLRRSVALIWVSGEEKGLLGSAAWAKEPWLPGGARAVANLNIDMIGRNAPDALGMTPSLDHEAHNLLSEVAQRAAPAEGVGELADMDAYWSRSDHAMFSEHLGIPVAFLFSDVHEDYHQPTDTADKLDYDKIRRVTRLVMRMLVELDREELEAEAR